MPIVEETIDAAVVTNSPIHYEQGVLELVDLAYGGGILANTFIIEERDRAGNWHERWRSPATNTAADYVPSKLNALDDGTAGTFESPISLRSPYGWRMRVTGVASGTVTAYISLREPSLEMI